MMKAAIVIACVMLSVLCAAPGAHAGEPRGPFTVRGVCEATGNVGWECGKRDQTHTQVPLPISDDYKQFCLRHGEIPPLELQKCVAFWRCVDDRGAGKVKHCYYPSRLLKI